MTLPVRTKSNMVLLAVAVALATSWSRLAVSGEYNPVLSIGDKAPEWKNLPGIDGKKLSLSDLKKKDVVVLTFICTRGRTTELRLSP